MLKQISHPASKSKYPRAEVLFLDEQKLLLIAIPWGNREPAADFLQQISEFYLASHTDEEATSPFQRIANLGTAGNNLNVAIQLANQKLYREINTKEWISGIQLMAAVQEQNEVIWAEYGGSSLFLKRANQNLHPLHISYDLSFDYNKSNILPPLPSKLLGVEPDIYLNFGSLKVKKNDSLFFVANSSLQLQDYQKSNFADLETLKQSILKQNANQALWLAQWEV